jgi:pilus assembly protein CpaF
VPVMQSRKENTMVSPTQPTPPTLPASLLADPALGPLAPLLADLSIMEIIINGPGQIFAERSGQLQRIDTPFESDAALRQAIRTLTGAEHILTDEAPIAEFRLPDGSQLKAVSPPIATDGTAMVFRRTAHGVIHLSQLIQFGALTEPIAAFLQACVRSRLNILV